MGLTIRPGKELEIFIFLQSTNSWWIARNCDFSSIISEYISGLLKIAGWYPKCKKHGCYAKSKLKLF